MKKMKKMNTKRLKAPLGWLSSPIKIVLVGCGGTGSEVFDILAMQHLALIARGGKGLDVVAYDPSLVRESNIVRQRFWPCDVGQYKSICLAHRYNMLLGTNWTGIPEEFPMLEGAKGGFQIAEDSKFDSAQIDVLISATDLPSARSKLSRLHLNKDTIWLDFGNGQDFGQAILGVIAAKTVKKSKAPKYPHVLDHYPDFHRMLDNSKKSCSTAEALLTQDILINRSVACSGMNLLWQLFKNGETDLNGCIINLATSKHTPLKFD